VWEGRSREAPPYPDRKAIRLWFVRKRRQRQRIATTRKRACGWRT
jgi:hypothetical protein